MGRFYSVTFSSVAVTAAQDLFAVVAGSSKPYRIHEIRLAQSSDAGDAQDEQLPLLIKRGATVAGSGGNSYTPIPLDNSEAAFGGTARINDTTIANTGTIVTLVSDAFNVRAGWIYLPTPECRIVVGGGVRCVVGLASAPADSLTMSGTMIVEEFGG